MHGYGKLLLKENYFTELVFLLKELWILRHTKLDLPVTVLIVSHCLAYYYVHYLFITVFVSCLLLHPHLSIFICYSPIMMHLQSSCFILKF